MNQAVVILPSTDWKLLAQRYCKVQKQSDRTKTTPFSSPALPCPALPVPEQAVARTGGLQTGAQALVPGSAGGGTLLDQERSGGCVSFQL